MYNLNINFNNSKKIKLEINDDQTILEKLIEKEIEIPFSCEIGTCGTCKVKLIKGTVEMENKSGLLDQELEENYILTCQAYLTSNSEIEILQE